MNATIEVDDIVFNDMLRRYVAVSSKSVADSINKKMGDVMLTAARLAPKANKETIDGLYKRPWWYKFVQKVLNIGGVVETKRRRVKKSEGTRIGRSGSFEEGHIWRDSSNGRLSNTRRTKGVRISYSGGQSRKNIGRVSRIITRRRRAGVAYFKGLFVATSQLFGKFTHGVRDGRLSSFGFDSEAQSRANKTAGITATGATESNPTAVATIPLMTKRKGDWPGGSRPSSSADLAMKSGIASFALSGAMAEQVNDMAEYVGRKLVEGGRQVGFRVAA